MNMDWQKSIAAWNLAEAGRWDAALAAANDNPGLVSVLSQRSGTWTQAEEPAIRGWQMYYKGNYRAALQELEAGSSHENDGWLRAWSQLGIAKIASDSGRWRVALDWCAVAWRESSKNEHLDLMAQVAGARGEVLVRAGRPIEAASAFAEDQALLGPGNRYRGRLRCYQAHAWSRSGPNGEKAAILAYRLAMHSVGEDITSAYAAAGLALLAARTNDCARLQAVQSGAFVGMPGFWVLVAAAHLATNSDSRSAFLRKAADTLPREYFAEHWWLAGWSRALGCQVSNPPILAECFPTHVPEALHGKFTLVERPVEGMDVSDAPWWGQEPAIDDDNAWWAIRDSFMP